MPSAGKCPLYGHLLSKEISPTAVYSLLCLQKCVGLDQNVQVFLIWYLLLLCNSIVDISDGFYKLIVICFMFLK